MKTSGRPKKERAKVRNNRITVRLSDEELVALFQKSQCLLVSPSTFLRMAGLSQNLPAPLPEINLSTYQELGRIGNNLNQFLRLLHQQKVMAIPDEIFVELSDLLRQVRVELKGKNDDRQTAQGQWVSRRPQLRIGPP
ncbi:plasmid mobilization relaxosome protein MobC [Geobacter sp.]|uniref:plasmid mobilization protein n=1 Tax=Geobacter sp. TaxID=46610 RepID=UPI0027B8F4DE|nr:plasmid mobilization relaxosome protein MobC [Geobacter sp.]